MNTFPARERGAVRLAARPHRVRGGDVLQHVVDGALGGVALAVVAPAPRRLLGRLRQPVGEAAAQRLVAYGSNTLKSGVRSPFIDTKAQPPAAICPPPSAGRRGAQAGPSSVRCATPLGPALNKCPLAIARLPATPRRKLRRRRRRRRRRLETDGAVGCLNFVVDVVVGECETVTERPVQKWGGRLRWEPEQVVELRYGRRRDWGEDEDVC
ncbi:Protein of unknown function [Gryllus bimaculatus]|nr:Protein of unknown function [Gryllus bimaculatus]